MWLAGGAAGFLCFGDCVVKRCLCNLSELFSMHCAVLCCAVLCCAVLCCAVLCRAMPCRAVSCRAALLDLVLSSADIWLWPICGFPLALWQP